MVYMGSKRRIAKYILPIMLQNRTYHQYFVDAFCGGCNIIDKVDGNRIANDNNIYLIALFKHLQCGGTLPLNITKNEYYEVKANKQNYPDWYVGHVGFNCSSQGKWFESYVSDGWICKNGTRNYQSEHINNLLNQISNLDDVCFLSKPYNELILPSNSIIYCDPPYYGTTGYKQQFDNLEFWQWCRDKYEEGHTIFVSEYQAPIDFTCIWEMDIKDSISPNKTIIKKERLFTLIK